MLQDVQEALSALRDLGSVVELETLAAQGLAPAQRPAVNSHIHLPPNFSAFKTVTQALDLASQQRVGVLGVSNYYDYSVYADFVAGARSRGIFPLFGLEIIALLDDLVKKGVKINDPGNPGKMYICGKGITRFAAMTPRAEELLGLIRRNDAARMAAMVEKMAVVFTERGLPTDLNENAVKQMIVKRHGAPPQTVYLQERHVCQAFQEALFRLVPAAQRIERLTKILGAPTKAGPDDAVRIQNDIRSHLMKAGKPAFVEETFVSFEQAYELILQLGGIPCYPTLADGTSPVCSFEEPVEKLIESLKARRVFCAEFIPIRNTPEVLTKYTRAMRKAGLVLVAGTEHNTLDLLPIEPACVGGAPVPEELKEIFWEGACIVAAHQFLMLHGQCGFVDEQGAPNPAYRSDEERIEAFRKLGAAVIERYYQTAGR